MPTVEHVEKHFTATAAVRDIVLGMADGLTVPFALAAGLTSAAAALAKGNGIIVTAAASHVPPPLIAQLKAGGRLVIPVGLPYHHQELLLVAKDHSGEVRTRSVLGVAFVPLTGDHPLPKPGSPQEAP